MLVLGIESTCDETCCSIVQDGKNILSNVISSQIDHHRDFGGVVPELASRKHIEMMLPVIEMACQTANISLKDLDLIAVANAPGLIGALLIGLHAAKGLALALGIPFIGVNHIEAHLYAALMSQSNLPSFPSLGVILSGGHTAIALVESIGSYQLIGQTIDDAIGEAFDKVAKMLGLPYPGGPQIEALAKGVPTEKFFKAGQVKDSPFHFSFSGLKTAVLYKIKKFEGMMTPLQKQQIAASFQETAFLDVLSKITKASEKYACNQVIFGGGVTNSQTLRLSFKEKCPHLNGLFPSCNLSLDNAAMIAGLGFHKFQQVKQGDSWDLEAHPTGTLFSP